MSSRKIPSQNTTTSDRHHRQRDSQSDSPRTTPSQEQDYRKRDSERPRRGRTREKRGAVERGGESTSCKGESDKRFRLLDDDTLQYYPGGVSNAQALTPRQQKIVFTSRQACKKSAEETIRILKRYCEQEHQKMPTEINADDIEQIVEYLHNKEDEVWGVVSHWNEVGRNDAETKEVVYKLEDQPSVTTEAAGSGGGQLIPRHHSQTETIQTATGRGSHRPPTQLAYPSQLSGLPSFMPVREGPPARINWQEHPSFRQYNENSTEYPRHAPVNPPTWASYDRSEVKQPPLPAGQAFGGPQPQFGQGPVSYYDKQQPWKSGLPAGEYEVKTAPEHSGYGLPYGYNQQDAEVLRRNREREEKVESERRMHENAPPLVSYFGSEVRKNYPVINTDFEISTDQSWQSQKPKGQGRKKS